MLHVFPRWRGSLSFTFLLRTLIYFSYDFSTSLTVLFGLTQPSFLFKTHISAMRLSDGRFVLQIWVKASLLS